MENIVRERLQVPRGTQHPDGTETRLADGEVWILHPERGLCVQEWESRDGTTTAYGVTHHTGYALTGPWFTYDDARALQLALLDLDLDWTGGLDLLRQAHPRQGSMAKMLILEWREAYAMFIDAAEQD